MFCLISNENNGCESCDKKMSVQIYDTITCDPSNYSNLSLFRLFSLAV